MEENASDEDKDDGSGEEDEEETKKKDEIEVGKLIPVDSHMDLANKHNISLAPNQVKLCYKVFLIIRRE